MQNFERQTYSYDNIRINDWSGENRRVTAKIVSLMSIVQLLEVGTCEENG